MKTLTEALLGGKNLRHSKNNVTFGNIKKGDYIYYRSSSSKETIVSKVTERETIKGSRDLVYTNTSTKEPIEISFDLMFAWENKNAYFNTNPDYGWFCHPKGHWFFAAGEENYNNMMEFAKNKGLI